MLAEDNYYHSDAANIAFIDGHAETVSRQEIQRAVEYDRDHDDIGSLWR